MSYAFTPRVAAGLVSAAVLVTTGCNWVSLARNAWSYPDLRPGDAGNLVVVADSLLYVTRGAQGLSVLDVRSGRELLRLPPPPGTESVDDVALAGNLLFALDARAPGHLSVFLLSQPLQPRLATGARDVPVGPFSRVSANDGLCIVSGGTSKLTAWRYDTTGVLRGPVATADLGRGQPGAVVAPGGQVAYVATHYWGPYFGLTVVRYDPAGGSLETLATLDLDGAGFTSGGAKPANFPIEFAVYGPDTLLVAFARGVAVINTSDPSHPRLEAVLGLGGPAVSVDARAGQAAVAVAGPNPGVVILGWSPAGLSVVRRHALAPGTLPAGVALHAASAAVALRDQGVLALQP